MMGVGSGRDLQLPPVAVVEHASIGKDCATVVGVGSRRDLEHPPVAVELVTLDWVSAALI